MGSLSLVANGRGALSLVANGTSFFSSQWDLFAAMLAANGIQVGQWYKSLHLTGFQHLSAVS